MKRRRSVALWGWWCVVTGMAAALACQPRDPTPAGRGARIFQRTCSGCHGADGRGTLRPGLSKPPRDLTNVEFQRHMSNDQLRHSIRVGKGQMPAFGGIMGDEEISDVIAFVRTLVLPGSLPPGALPPGAPGQPSAAPAVPPEAPTAQGVRSP